MSNAFANALGSEQTSFWGLVTFEAESYDKITEVLSSPEYTKLVYPDEKNVIDRTKSQVLAGEYANIFRV